MDVLTTFDKRQAEKLSSGVHVYATVEEMLEVEDLAKLTGMVFCETAGADLALIANATGHLMQTLEEKKIPAGTFGKTVAEPAAVCATTEL